MLSYKDKTFCINKKCKSKDRCKDYLTEEIIEEAKNADLPISMCKNDCENLDMEDKKI